MRRRCLTLNGIWNSREGKASAVVEKLAITYAPSSAHRKTETLVQFGLSISQLLALLFYYPTKKLVAEKMGTTFAIQGLVNAIYRAAQLHLAEAKIVPSERTSSFKLL